MLLVISHYWSCTFIEKITIIYSILYFKEALLMLRKGLELWMVEDDAQDQVIYFTTVFFNFFQSF